MMKTILLELIVLNQNFWYIQFLNFLELFSIKKNVFEFPMHKSEGK